MSYSFLTSAPYFTSACNDVQRRIDACMQIDHFPLLARVDVREVLQVLNDLAHALEALQRFGDQRWNITLQVVEIDLRTQRRRCFGLGRTWRLQLGGAICKQHSEQALPGTPAGVPKFENT